MTSKTTPHPVGNRSLLSIVNNCKQSLQARSTGSVIIILFDPLSSLFAQAYGLLFYACLRCLFYHAIIYIYIYIIDFKCATCGLQWPKAEYLVNMEPCTFDALGTNLSLTTSQASGSLATPKRSTKQCKMDFVGLNMFKILQDLATWIVQHLSTQ